LQVISKEEMEWLLEMGYLKKVKGRIKDLVICNRGKKHGRKTHYVTDHIYEKLSKGYSRGDGS